VIGETNVCFSPRADISVLPPSIPRSKFGGECLPNAKSGLFNAAFSISLKKA
jgi:hypothetical protein